MRYRAPHEADKLNPVEGAKIFGYTIVRFSGGLATLACVIHWQQLSLKVAFNTLPRHGHSLTVATFLPNAISRVTLDWEDLTDATL